MVMAQTDKALQYVTYFTDMLKSPGELSHCRTKKFPSRVPCFFNNISASSREIFPKYLNHELRWQESPLTQSNPLPKTVKRYMRLIVVTRLESLRPEFHKNRKSEKILNQEKLDQKLENVVLIIKSTMKSHTMGYRAFEYNSTEQILPHHRFLPWTNAGLRPYSEPSKKRSYEKRLNRWKRMKTKVHSVANCRRIATPLASKHRKKRLYASS